MTRERFDALMAASPPATQAAGKRALAGDPERTRKVPLCHACGGIDGHKPACWKAAGLDHENDRVGFFAGGYTPPLQTIHDKKKPAIRIPKKRVPNKTEARFMSFAADRWPHATVMFEPMRFRLPSGCYYTPDVLIHTHEEICLVETKGAFIHNQRSIHAFKEARAAFPMFRWIFAQYRDGEWALAELPQ